jgi:hypothetical protein
LKNVTVNTKDEGAKTVGSRRVLAWVAASVSCFAVTAVILGVVHISLLRTSKDLDAGQAKQVERAIRVLEYRGFTLESALLRNFVNFRASDHWLNALVQPGNAFAATNFPFGIITLHPDFFEVAADDTERAMILLHESRHVIGGSEKDAFAHVWKNRHKLGWTILTHGTTQAYMGTEFMTREEVPELFTCTENLWGDCTEQLRAGK